MGRQQKRNEERRRKEELKNTHSKMNMEQLDTTIKKTTIIKLAGFVVISLVVIYYLLAIFVTKEIKITNGSDSDKASESAVSSSGVSDRILASNIFNQSEEKYYVYFYDFDDENNVVASAVSNVDGIVYKVDTGSSLNANYVTEENGNKKATSIDELKVKSPTVIKVEGDKIVEYYEGSNEIYKGLK